MKPKRHIFKLFSVMMTIGLLSCLRPQGVVLYNNTGEWISIVSDTKVIDLAQGSKTLLDVTSGYTFIIKLKNAEYAYHTADLASTLGYFKKINDYHYAFAQIQPDGYIYIAKNEADIPLDVSSVEQPEGFPVEPANP